MKLHKYKNYKEYVQKQVSKNKRKLHLTWAREDVMKGVADYVAKSLPGAKFGICHGAKNGFEVEQLRKNLGIDVIGTDLSDSAKQFKHMIEWDFHKVKPEWLGKTDFIYSNALDHSPEPDHCFDQWMSCLQPKGFCFVEWSEWHDTDTSSEDDPFGASLEEYKELFNRKYRVIDVLSFPVKSDHNYPMARTILVVGHKA